MTAAVCTAALLLGFWLPTSALERVFHACNAAGRAESALLEIDDAPRAASPRVESEAP